MKIVSQPFGNTKENKEVLLFRLENDKNLIVKITNYGAIVTDIQMPNKEGLSDHIALGFDSLEKYTSQEYIDNCPYFGAIAGRYANRIKEGKFSIDGKEYQLAVNNGPNALHGGIVGLDKVVWNAEMEQEENEVSLILTYKAKDQEEGFPGNTDITVVYTLTNDNQLFIKYRATTDQKTIINLTNHTYFNLNGINHTIKDHDLVVNAPKVTPVDNNLIPTGEYASTEGTSYDFRTQKNLGEGIDSLEEGYDINFVLDKEKDPLYAGTLSHQESGRSVSVYTTQPGLQVYTGYYIPEFTGLDNKKYGRYMGVALETQHFPDSPNQPHFPSTILEPEKPFEEITCFQFEII
ncbi:MAG: galactose mutarotase [Prolixibacteraceae bacterium]|jgi:aldose 1-epimerase|nr:galactose mutarotase [Prolixibacteraceae bacterium]